MGGRPSTTGFGATTSASSLQRRRHRDASFGPAHRRRTSRAPERAGERSRHPARRRIVAAGYTGGSTGTFDFALARYAADGTLDAAFGTAGRVAIDLSGDDDFGEGVALQADGKVVAVGRRTSSTSSDLALVRLGADGAADGGFGAGGTLAVDFFGAADFGLAVAIQADGRIVAAGHALNGAASNLVLVRVRP